MRKGVRACTCLKHALCCELMNVRCSLADSRYACRQVQRISHTNCAYCKKAHLLAVPMIALSAQAADLSAV